eukprot:scaffold184153_cov31-Tisochrysis_lutea.AAC.2
MVHVVLVRPPSGRHPPDKFAEAAHCPRKGLTAMNIVVRQPASQRVRHCEKQDASKSLYRTGGRARK